MIRPIILLLLAVVLNFSAEAQRKKNTNRDHQTSEIDYKLQNAPLPPLRIKNLNGPVFDNSDVEEGKNFLLMLFNPTCGHCEDQAKLMVRHPEIFTNTQIQLLFSNMIDTNIGKGFQQAYATHNGWVLPVGVDSGKTIENIFTYQTLPQINIYNKDKRLIKTFTGNIPLDSLKVYLQ